MNLRNFRANIFHFDVLQKASKTARHKKYYFGKSPACPKNQLNMYETTRQVIHYSIKYFATMKDLNFVKKIRTFGKLKYNVLLPVERNHEMLGCVFELLSSNLMVSRALA